MFTVLGRMLRVFKSLAGHQQGTVLFSGALDSFLGKHAVKVKASVSVFMYVCVCVHPCVYNVY